MSFGHGAHCCLGANLVRQELQVNLTTLARFPGCGWRSRPTWLSGSPG
jgi:cytochrome P450